MPITDYEHNSEIAETNFFNSGEINKTNKDAVREYLSGWIVRKGVRKGLPVKPSRRSIFFKHIIFFLQEVEDVKKDMFDCKKIDLVFSKLQKELSKGYYGTVVNVSLAFVTKLNDRERPKGFKNIERISKKQQQRDIKPDDMITWDEGLELIKQSNSIQFKAIVMAQLDGGFRPSEFIDLNYGDVKKDGKYFIIGVDGKTGKRDVILYRSSPYLNRWYQNHPTGKDSDPFWIMENPNKSRKTKNKIVRYSYPAVRKRVEQLGFRAGIKKPLDFYNFRHSACSMAKRENTPTDLAAEKFGHSVDYYVNTYGRLTTEEKVNRHKRHNGEKVKDNETEESKADTKPILCSFCDTTNEPNKEICEKCGSPLSLKKALQVEKVKSKELTDMKKQINDIPNLIEQLMKEKMEELEKATK